MPSDLILEQIQAAGWHFSEELWEQLDAYQKDFARLEFTADKTPEFYRNRLLAIGFSGYETVLDVGCGMGQWTMALAQLNQKVYGFDIHEKRLEIAQNLLKAHELGNADIQQAFAEKIPLPDKSAQAIFCYGVFMFTDMPSTLREFYRLLRPGGRIYLNANTWGWYAHLLVDRGLKQGNLGMVKTALKMIFKSYRKKYRQNILVQKSWLEERLLNAGFHILALDKEGQINLALDAETFQKIPRFYRLEYYGLPSIWEVVAEKV